MIPMGKEIMQLTEWHDGTKKPVHIGVYQRKINENEYWSKWSGNSWMAINPIYKLAAKEKEESSFQCLKWRGITK